MVSREIIFQAAEEAGLVRTHSCCNVDLKLCQNDEWRGNLEGFANAILRLTTSDITVDRSIPIFNKIKVQTMKLKWLLEPEVFKDDSDEFINTLKKLKVDHTICEFGKPYEGYIAKFKESDRVLFHGSLQFAKLIQSKSNCITVYCNLPKYECLFYYPRFGQHLLNSNYIMLPFGELNRRKDWLLEHVGSPVFIRPSSGYKTFTGITMSKASWDAEVRFLGRFVDIHALIIVAPVLELNREWRVVVVENKIITGCQYKDQGKIVRIKGVPREVMDYGQGVLDSMEKSANLYQPDPAWTLDICETQDGQLKVLEVGSFSCAGFYACDPEIIIQAMDSLVT